MGVRVVLASSSPRRRQLLDLIGLRHDVRPADIAEALEEGEQPRPHAIRLATEKVRKVAASERSALVVGADTVVVLEGRVLGKPADAAESRAMIGALAGRTHTVITGMAVAYAGKVVADAEEVAVTFRALSAAEIDGYVATGEGMDKAGGYGIQGFGATIVRRVEGDYFAVMGLSLVKLVELLGKVGLAYRFGELSPRK